MSHKKLRPFVVKVSVLGYFPLYKYPSARGAVMRDGHEECACVFIGH